MDFCGPVRVLEDVTYDKYADYGGRARKIGIIVDGMRYLVKFQGRETTRNADSVISEYLSSHIACAFGIPAHETTIVSIDGELAVACKNFEGPGERHIDFDRLMRRHYASKDVGKRLTIAQIREVLNTDRQLAPAIEENRRSFWDMFVFDAIVGNHNRHAGNWGYLVRPVSDVARQSPVCDNASTLYPTVSEDHMPRILEDAKEVARRVILFPNSAIEHRGHRLSYYDVLMSGYAGSPAAVERLAPSVDRQGMFEIVDETPMSDVRRAFLKTMLSARLGLLYYPALERARTVDFDRGCARRLDEGRQMTVEDFDRMWQESLGRDTALGVFSESYSPISVAEPISGRWGA